MIRRLAITALLCLVAAICMAAGKPYYQEADINTLPDAGRLLIYDPATGSKNITGAKIKSEVKGSLTSTEVLTTLQGASATPLSKRADAGATPYARQIEVRNAAGVITMWVNTIGQMVFGTPLPLAVSSVYPTNGATNVSNGVWFNYSSTSGGYNYWGRINTTTPVVTYNKPDHPNGAISPAGASTADQTGIYTAFNNFSGAAGALYTITANRITYVQTDGEITSSCGATMTDVAGVCTSTFRMK